MKQYLEKRVILGLILFLCSLPFPVVATIYELPCAFVFCVLVSGGLAVRLCLASNTLTKFKKVGTQEVWHD